MLLSSGVIGACSLVELRKVVTNGLADQFTMEAEVKPVPVTVITKYAPPASTVLGEEEMIAGMARMSKGSVPEVLPSRGLRTCTVAALTTVKVFAGMTAVSVPELMRVVASTACFPPALSTRTSPAVKPKPVTVMVTGGLPIKMLAGATVERPGATVMGYALETVPSGLAIVRLNLPERSLKSGVISAVRWV